MNKVFLGFGSNVGHREKNISLALDHLKNTLDVSLIKISKEYETIAVAQYQQPNYINLVALVETVLTPLELLDLTESIEKKMGRISKGLGDPRIIDIDILFYNNDILSLDRLTIPHALAHERLFVLDPMQDIAPQFIHPILNISMMDLRNQLNGY